MSMKVLVVEDEGIARLHIIHILKRLGHEVIGWASSGEQAVSMALGENPDLIMMDIGLEGEISGIQAAEAILREIEAVVIFLTAYTLEELKQHYDLPQGANYIPKPVMINDLEKHIEKAISRRI